MVISAKNIVHSAFYLATTLLCVAVYFIMLRAQYLAAVQILVYMGAVVVLILFALMFTRTAVGDYTNISSKQTVFAGVVALMLFAALTVVFNITFDDYDPYLATLKANALAESYIEEVIESGINAKQRTGDNISKQLPELDKKVIKSEQALKDFQAKHKVFLPESGDQLAVQELGQLGTRINELKRNKLNLESVYRRIISVDKDPLKLARIPALLEKSEVVKQKSQFAATQARVSELGLVYGPKHPKMKQAMESKRLAENEYHSILMTAADLVVLDYESITQEISHEEQGISSIKGEISSNNALAFEYDALTRDYEYNKQIYAAFLKQSKETDAVKSASLQGINARVLNKAVVPAFPYKPNKKTRLKFIASGYNSEESDE